MSNPILAKHDSQWIKNTNRIILKAHSPDTRAIPRAKKMKLQISEVQIPWWPLGERGELFVAYPGAKPPNISDDDWVGELIHSSCEQGIQNIVAPTSVCPYNTGASVVISGKSKCRLFHLKDEFEFNVDDLTGDTPLECIREIYRALQNSENVLVVSVKEKISGFLPAALSILADPAVHIVKVVYPITQAEGYVLSSQQIAYLYGFSDAINRRT